MSHLFFALLVLSARPALALVSCAPTSCSPGCDSSCSYQVCGAAATNSFLLRELPHTYVAAGDACQDNLNGQVIRQIPTSQLSGVHQMPTTATTPYMRCQTLTISGPPCPPPLQN